MSISKICRAALVAALFAVAFAPTMAGAQGMPPARPLPSATPPFRVTPPVNDTVLGTDLLAARQKTIADWTKFMQDGVSACNHDLYASGVSQMQNFRTTLLRELDHPDSVSADELVDAKTLLPQVEAALARIYYPEPCPAMQFTGFSFGIAAALDWGDHALVERLASSGVVTNEFFNSGTATGVGIDFAYGIYLPDSFVLTPYISADFNDVTIEQTFPGGFFIGSESRFIGTGGVQLGLEFPGFEIYTLAGVSVLSEDLNMNFGGPVTSVTETVTGLTAGLGANYQTGIAPFGSPLSIYVQYQHYWWQDAQLLKPPSSPAFNYAFQREDDTFKIGVRYFPGK